MAPAESQSGAQRIPPVGPFWKRQLRTGPSSIWTGTPEPSTGKPSAARFSSSTCVSPIGGRRTFAATGEWKPSCGFTTRALGLRRRRPAARDLERADHRPRGSRCRPGGAPGSGRTPCGGPGRQHPAGTHRPARERRGGFDGIDLGVGYRIEETFRGTDGAHCSAVTEIKRRRLLRRDDWGGARSSHPDLRTTDAFRVEADLTTREGEETVRTRRRDETIPRDCALKVSARCKAGRGQTSHIFKPLSFSCKRRRVVCGI